MYMLISTATNNTSFGNSVITFLMEYFWLPLIIPLIIFVTKSIFDNALTVKEIKNVNDRDIEGFCNLYNSRIKDELRIDVEEILQFIGRNSNSNVKHHLLICKHKGNVVGFLKFMISNPEKYLFIAYIAIDNKNKQALNHGVEKMIRKTVRKYFKPKRASIMITEIEQGERGKYYTVLARLISRYAKRYKLNAYYIDCPYIQPQMPGEESNPTPEDFLSLIYVPYYNLENQVITKQDFLDIINFIYFGIYGPSCNSLMCDCKSYNQYLMNLVNEYRQSYSDYITLYPLGKEKK